MKEYPKYIEQFVCSKDRCLEYHCPGDTIDSKEDTLHKMTAYPKSTLTVKDYVQEDLSLSCMDVGTLFFGPNMNMKTVSETGETFTGDDVLDMYRGLRDQLVETVLDPGSPLEDLFDWNETDDEIIALMESMEVRSEDWEKALHAVKLLKTRKDYISAETLFKEQQMPFIDPWFRKLGAYFFFRYTVDAYFDGDMAMERALVFRSLKFLYLMCFARWSKRGHPLSMYDMIDLAHVYSYNIEHSAENLKKVKSI